MKGIRHVALVFALGMTAVACGPSTSSPSAPSGSLPGASASPPTSASPSAGARAILVDTDVAPDDVMALAYLLARPTVDIVAVTVSGTGEARCPDGVRVVRGLLERLGHPDVPVACGRDTPLVGDHAFPAAWRDLVATGFGLDLPGPTGNVGDADAPTLLARAADEAGGALDVLTLGPLTNVADALTADPTLADRIANITIMGGAVLAPGNVGDPEGDGTSVNAEWNAYIDPHALAVVLASGTPVTLVPLDATDDVPMSRRLALRIAANRGTASAALVYELLARNPDRVANTSLWDETAALLLADGPDGLTLERQRLAVIEDEGREAGRTVMATDGTQALVAMAADAGVVTRRFVEGLAGGAVEAPLPSPVVTLEASFDGTTCAVAVPGTIPTGFARVAFRNSASVDAGVVVIGFTGDATWESVLALVAQGPVTQAPEGVTTVVSVGAPAAGSSEDVVPLDPGSYGALCGSYEAAGLRVVPGVPFTVAP